MMDDLDRSPFGLSSLEPSLATAATALVRTGILDWLELFDRMSTRPAQIAGLDNAGSLLAGKDADIVVVDPNAGWKVDPTQFRSTCISTPLEGAELIGKVKATIVAGQVRFNAAG